MNNQLSYCGVDAKIRVSDKDLPVLSDKNTSLTHFEFEIFLACLGLIL
jgi:hypothetical protein